MPSWPGKKKELDAMEAFGIFDVCEELPKDAKVITTRWENVPKGDKWRCRFVPESSDMTVQKWKGSTHQAAHRQQVDWWTCMRSNTDVQSCASMWRTRTSMPMKTRKSTVGLQKNGSRGIMQELVEWRIHGGS